MFPRLIIIAAAMILVSAPCASNAAEKGWFGFALAIDAEGSWFSPKLRSIKIDKVIPASPAAKADNVKAAGLSA